MRAQSAPSGGRRAAKGRRKKLRRYSGAAPEDSGRGCPPLRCGGKPIRTRRAPRGRVVRAALFCRPRPLTSALRLCPVLSGPTGEERKGLTAAAVYDIILISKIISILSEFLVDTLDEGSILKEGVPAVRRARPARSFAGEVLYARDGAVAISVLSLRAALAGCEPQGGRRARAERAADGGKRRPPASKSAELDGVARAALHRSE